MRSSICCRARKRKISERSATDRPRLRRYERRRLSFADRCDNDAMGELSDRLIAELVDAVRAQLRKEQSERQRDVYLIGDIEKDTARLCIERLRELANDNTRPISLYINSAGGNVTDGLAIHDVVRHIISRGHRGVGHRPGHGVLDGLDRPAGGERRAGG